MLIYQIFQVLFPIFTIILIGYLYAHYRPIDMTTANRLAMDIFSPALTFTVMVDKSFDIINYQQLALAGTLIILGSGVIVWPLVNWLKLNVKTFIPPMMFTNTGNMGIPLLVFSFGETALPAAILLLVVSLTLHFTLGVYLLNRQTSWWTVLKLPIIQATFAGVIVSLIHLKIPELWLTPIRMLGNCTIPLMLFSLGVRLDGMNLTHWRIGVLGAIICPLSGLLMFLLIQPWLSLTSSQVGILLMFSVLPPAVFNYLLAEQYQQEPQKVAAIVMVGNLMSLVSLPLALSFALPKVI